MLLRPQKPSASLSGIHVVTDDVPVGVRFRTYDAMGIKKALNQRPKMGLNIQSSLIKRVFMCQWVAWLAEVVAAGPGLLSRPFFLRWVGQCAKAPELSTQGHLVV